MTPAERQALIERISARITLLSGLQIGERGLRLQIEATIALLRDAAEALRAAGEPEWQPIDGVPLAHASRRGRRGRRTHDSIVL